MIDFLKTEKKESFKTWMFRSLMNWYPMYLGTGGKILFWAADSTEVHLQVGLNMWTRNYVGTIFGGSFFSASDPFYMVMLMRILGWSGIRRPIFASESLGSPNCLRFLRYPRKN